MMLIIGVVVGLAVLVPLILYICCGGSDEGNTGSAPKFLCDAKCIVISGACDKKDITKKANGKYCRDAKSKDKNYYAENGYSIRYDATTKFWAIHRPGKGEVKIYRTKGTPEKCDLYAAKLGCCPTNGWYFIEKDQDEKGIIKANATEAKLVFAKAEDDQSSDSSSSEQDGPTFLVGVDCIMVSGACDQKDVTKNANGQYCRKSEDNHYYNGVSSYSIRYEPEKKIWAIYTNGTMPSISDMGSDLVYRTKGSRENCELYATNKGCPTSGWYFKAEAQVTVKDVEDNPNLKEKVGCIKDDAVEAKLAFAPTKADEAAGENKQ